MLAATLLTTPTIVEITTTMSELMGIISTVSAQIGRRLCSITRATLLSVHTQHSNIPRAAVVVEALVVTTCDTS